MDGRPVGGLGLQGGELPLDAYDGEAEEEEKDEEEDGIEANSLFFGSGEARREGDMEIEDGE